MSHERRLYFLRGMGGEREDMVLPQYNTKKLVKQFFFKADVTEVLRQISYFLSSTF